MSRLRGALIGHDANHELIVRAYEELFCTVVDTSSQGRGFPDLLVIVPTRAGRIIDLVEVKTEDGIARPNQVVFQRDVYAFTIVRTSLEVQAHVERVQGRFR